jgi:hypothetical protein
MALSIIKYKTLGFGVDGDQIFAKVQIYDNDDDTIINLFPPTSKCKYYPPSNRMVTQKSNPVVTNKINVLSGIVRTGIISAIQMGMHPSLRSIEQWEFDRYCANGHEPIAEYDWNAELYRAVLLAFPQVC